jgi:tRNA A37 threonylcarbamoyladenosine modification protein TsaB
MDAVALPLLKKGVSAVVLLDARKDEVYAAYYPVLDKSNLPHRDGDVMLISLDSVPDWVSSLNDPRAHLAGTGLHLLAEKGFLDGFENLGDGSEAPDAAWILSLAETLLPLGHTVEPSDLVPCYVRPPDAKRPSPGTIVTKAGETGDRTDGF